MKVCILILPLLCTWFHMYHYNYILFLYTNNFFFDVYVHQTNCFKNIVKRLAQSASKLLVRYEASSNACSKATSQQGNNHPAPPPSVRLSLSPLTAAVLVTTPHPLLPLLPEPPPRHRGCPARYKTLHSRCDAVLTSTRPIN